MRERASAMRSGRRSATICLTEAETVRRRTWLRRRSRPHSAAIPRSLPDHDPPSFAAVYRFNVALFAGCPAHKPRHDGPYDRRSHRHGSSVPFTRLSEIAGGLPQNEKVPKPASNGNLIASTTAACIYDAERFRPHMLLLCCF